LTKPVLFQVPPSEPDSVLENSEVKKKKRKAKKKKRMNLETEECANTGWDWGFKLKPDCLYPFTSSRSVLQRKIKQQYDELVKINDSKKLTLPQVSFFFFFFFNDFSVNFEFFLCWCLKNMFF
jgi:hypothetical protein